MTPLFTNRIFFRSFLPQLHVRVRSDEIWNLPSAISEISKFFYSLTSRWSLETWYVNHSGAPEQCFPPCSLKDLEEAFALTFHPPDLRAIVGAAPKFTSLDLLPQLLSTCRNWNHCVLPPKNIDLSSFQLLIWLLLCGMGPWLRQSLFCRRLQSDWADRHGGENSRTACAKGQGKPGHEAGDLKTLSSLPWCGD